MTHCTVRDASARHAGHAPHAVHALAHPLFLRNTGGKAEKIYDPVTA